VSYEGTGLDDRQNRAEEAHAEAMHAASVFTCECCGDEHDLWDRVVFTRHPEMPAYCWVCATSESVGGTYP